MADQPFVRVFIQARMGSQRLPGKVLMPLAGKPVINHLLDAVEQAVDCENMLVLTSQDPGSDPLEQHLKDSGYHVFRGDETNVASRFEQALATYPCDYLIRLSGDSPLFDPAVLSTLIEEAKAHPADLITTVSDRPYPSGMNAELLKTETFLNHYPKFSDPGHFEHVTRYFYEHRERFDIRGISCPIDQARAHKFTLDTPEDLERITAFFAALDQPHHQYSLAEKCQIYQQLFGIEHA